MSRKRKSRRTTATNIECTCDLKHELDPKYDDHDSRCDLWHVEDFMNGLADWNPVAQRLEATINMPWNSDHDGWDGVDGFGHHVPMDEFDLPPLSALTPGRKWNSCRHNMTPLHLPDGTLVHGSASTDVRQSTFGHRPNGPAWAVYLSPVWYPSGLALFVPWEDYGTPTCSWRTAREAVQDFYKRARAGQTVEVGCMGGHGRTGTFLACLVLMADPQFTPAGAIQYVRTHYCAKAVEDASQEWFVRWFADPSIGPWVPPPPKPRPNANAEATMMTVQAQLAVMEAKAAGRECDHVLYGSVTCTQPMGHVGNHKHTPRPAQCLEFIARNSKTGEEYHCTDDQGHTGHHRYVPAQVRS